MSRQAGQDFVVNTLGYQRGLCGAIERVKRKDGNRLRGARTRRAVHIQKLVGPCGDNERGYNSSRNKRVAAEFFTRGSSLPRRTEQVEAFRDGTLHFGGSAKSSARIFFQHPFQQTANAQWR